MSGKNKSEDLRAIDCDEVMRQLFDFLDGEVDEMADKEIHHHIDECRSCFSRVEFEQMLRARIRKSRDEGLPDSLQERVTELMKGFSVGNIKPPREDKE